MMLEECSSAVCKFEIEQPVSLFRIVFSMHFEFCFRCLVVFLPNQRTDAEFG